MQFERNTFQKRLKSMLSVDVQRTFKTPLFYIMLGISLVMPVLILVMTTMMDGMVSVDPQTGVETVIEGFKNTWQIIGTTGESMAAGGASMDMTSMCNINLLYFAVAVYVCLFVSEDFRSGYAKNLFTVRAAKTDYVVSKTIVLFFSGACLFVAFFVGTLLGGAIAGLPFTLDTGAFGLAACMISKALLVAAFMPMYLAVSVAAKQKTWLALLGSLGMSALLFMMVPMLTPLDSTLVNVLLCLVGGAGFSVGLGVVSNAVLKKTCLV